MAIKTWDWTYTLWQALTWVPGRWVWIRPILQKYYKNLMYMFFDFNTINSKSKAIKPKMLPFEDTITVNWSSIKWMQYKLDDKKCTISGVISKWAAWVATAWAVDSSTWFAVNDLVKLVRLDNSEPATWETFDWIITAVGDWTHVTFDPLVDTDCAPLTRATDKLVRTWFIRAEDSEIAERSDSFAYDTFESYFQRFWRRIKFTKTELNAQYIMEADVKDLLNQKFWYQILILLKELNRAIYEGRNIQSRTVVSQTWSWTTWWIMLWLRKVCEECAVVLASISESWSVVVSSTTWITTVQSTASEAARIEALFQVLDACNSSSVYNPGESVTVACNQAFISNLSKFRQDKIRYTTIVNSLWFEMIKVWDVFWNAEFFHDPILDEMYPGWSVWFFFPRSQIRLQMRKWQSVDATLNIQAAQRDIRVEKVIDNVHDISKLDMFFECWLIAWGTDTWAYRLLKGI